MTGPDPSLDLAGEVAVVTGGTRGLGRAVVDVLLARGARVVTLGRNPGRLERLREETRAPDRLHTVLGDVADPELPARAYAETVAAFGAPSLVVINAAVSPIHDPMVEMSRGDFLSVLSTNVVQANEFVACAVRAGLGRGNKTGAVVNVGSVGGLDVAEGFGAYGVSKAALHHLTRQLAVELAPRIRVNAVAPAVFESHFSSPLLTADPDLARRYPLGRLGTSSDVAQIVAFLLSPAAAWITGQVYVVDGGLSLSSGTSSR